MPKASDNPSMSLFDELPVSESPASVSSPPGSKPAPPPPAVKLPPATAPAAPAAPAKVERDVYTVARLNREVRQLLEQRIALVWLEGELSNFSSPASGHWYFSLKDREAQSRCAMFRM
jgi:hypothetical protein